jgi:hypothetical protein
MTSKSEIDAATAGMTSAINEKLREVLEEGLKGLDETDRKIILGIWQKIALAVATGVTEYITAKMEIRGVQTQGNITVSMKGDTATAAARIDHKHGIALSAQAANVKLAQSNDGTGLVGWKQE